MSGKQEERRELWRQKMKPAGEAKPQAIELMLASGDHLRIPGDAATLRLVLSVLRERQA